MGDAQAALNDRWAAWTSIVDQGILAGTNLIIAVAFIACASKEEYGLYGVIFSATLLVQSLQNGLLLSPLTTVASLRSEKEREEVLVASRSAQWRLGLGVALCGTLLGVAAARWGVVLSYETALYSGIGLLGVWFREYRRAECFIRGQAVTALIGDAAYAALTLSWIAFLAHRGWVQAGTALLGMGLAGILTGTRFGSGRQSGSHRWRKNEWPVVRKEIVHCASWASPSAGASWLQANAYVYVAGAFLGLEAVAELNAARLFLAPLPLFMQAWVNVFRPRATRLVGRGETDKLTLAVWQAMWRIGLAATAYALLAYLAYLGGLDQLLGEEYQGLSGLVAMWGVLYCVSAIRAVGTASLLSWTEGFRVLTEYVLIAMTLSVPVQFAMARLGGAMELVAAMALGELVLFLLIFGRGWPRLTRRGFGRVSG